MVIPLRRLVCIYILRPSVEGAFLIGGSRAASSLHRRNLSHYMSTQQPTTGSNHDGSASWPTNVGQQNNCRQNTEDDVDTEVVEESLVDTDANDEMTIIDKSWRQLLEVSNARSRKIRGSNYVQIATIDSTTNEPRCRTVVFRGFHNANPLPTQTSDVSSPRKFNPSTSYIIDPFTNKPLPCIMKMCTDSRSEKVHQTGPTEVVWWFSKTSEQYRIRGTMILIGNEPLEDVDRDLMIARKEMWGSLTDSSRQTFLTIQRPGDAYVKVETKDVDRINGGRDTDGKIIQPPPDTFLLMLVIPDRCEYLNLTNMFRQVDTATGIDGRWQSQRVNA